jgi:5'-3' exoribonuclease 2
LNGLIHPCTHPVYGPQPSSEEEMFLSIRDELDHLIRHVCPRKLLYLAIDGVAPRAKMNQQRERRFKSAKDAKQKKADQERDDLDFIELYGDEVFMNKILPYRRSAWDSNQITPGTLFMDRVAANLREYICERLAGDPLWAHLTVILSDSNVPGEGEHKIYEFIRRQRAAKSMFVLVCFSF